MTEEQARDELRLQVAEIMNDVATHAIERLNHLMNSGAGIVESHIQSSKRYAVSYAAAKDFLVAFLAEESEGYRRQHESQEDRKRIKIYLAML